MNVNLSCPTCRFYDQNLKDSRGELLMAVAVYLSATTVMEIEMCALWEGLKFASLHFFRLFMMG